MADPPLLLGYRVMQMRSAFSQCGASRPKDVSNFSLDIRELAGRAAGVGYEAAGMGFTEGFFSSVELSKIACANPCHDVEPDVVR